MPDVDAVDLQTLCYAFRLYPIWVAIRATGQILCEGLRPQQLVRWKPFERSPEKTQAVKEAISSGNPEELRILDDGTVEARETSSSVRRGHTIIGYFVAEGQIDFEVAFGDPDIAKYSLQGSGRITNRTFHLARSSGFLSHSNMLTLFAAAHRSLELFTGIEALGTQGSVALEHRWSDQASMTVASSTQAERIVRILQANGYESSHSKDTVFFPALSAEEAAAVFMYDAYAGALGF